MSLQDDYFDVNEYLTTNAPMEIANKFEALWEYLVDLESEVDDLREIRGCVRRMIEKTFPQETEDANASC